MATLEFANGAIGTLTASLTSRAPWLFQTVILGDRRGGVDAAAGGEHAVDVASGADGDDQRSAGG